MKTRKIFSVLLTLTLLASCFASMTVMNVSAHQNYHMNTITFDETKADGSFVYATGNSDVAEGGTYKDIGNVQYGNGTFGLGVSHTKYTYADIKTAPDARYGKSLYYYEWYESGANQPYVQAAISPNVVNNSANRGLNGTVRITASLYTENNESNVYCQRAIKLRTTTTGGYKESFAVLFNHEKTRDIIVLGNSTKKTYKPDVWYDVDLTYNIDNSQFHVIIYEDGIEYVNMIGTSTTPLKNVGTAYIYHSPQDATRNHIKVYWDNISINSVDKLVLSESDKYPLMDFENLEDHVAGEISVNGLPSVYGYSYGFQGNPELPILKALETEKGISACVYGAPYPGAENTSIVPNRYQYPQWVIGTNISQFHMKTSVKFQNTKLCGIYLNGSGTPEIRFYDDVRAFGRTLFTPSYDKTGNVWYDIDLIIDTATGFYDLTMSRSDTGETKNITGFTTNYLTPITSVKFGHDRGSGTAATFVNESFFWVDDLYIGTYGVDDVESEYTMDFNDGIYPSSYSVTYADVNMGTLTATSGQYGTEEGTAENPVSASEGFAIPFIVDKPYYQITAKFTLEDLNSNKLVYFGNLPILEILPTGQVKCNQSGRPYSEGYLVPGNEYTLTHEMQAGCTVSKTTVSGIMDVNGTIKESSAGYGSGRPSGPFSPFKVVVIPTNDAEKQSTLTLTDINISSIKYATATSKNYKMESLENAAPQGTIFLPHDKAGVGYVYTADVTFNNFDVARSFKFGTNAPFATIDTNGILTMGENTAQLEADKVYELKITTNHGETSKASISLAGIEGASDATPYIYISQDKGAASTMSIDNVHYVAMVDLKVKSGEVLKNVHVSDSVNLTFSNALAADVTKDNFKVYAPTGTITDAALVQDYDVAFSEDRKTAILTFAKTGSKHYHITFDVKDVYGAVVSDWVEVNTAPNPEAGSVAISVENRTATASFTSTGKEGNVFFAVALYANDELVSIVPSDITLSKADIEKEYTVSITAPNDGVTYTAKAFRWDSATQNPYEGAITATQTVAAQ